MKLAAHYPRKRTHCRGQALVETALIVVALVLLVAGIAEVGWAFMRTSMITHAARDGARFGATLGGTQRDANTGCFTGDGTTQVQDHVNEVLSSIGFTGATVNVNQGCNGTVPTVEVNITGDVELLFGFIGNSFAVNRSVIFEDERRTGCAC